MKVPKFQVGQEVLLMNSKNSRVKAASGTISAIGDGVAKVWHGKSIPIGMYRVDVTTIMDPDISLMVPDVRGEQWKMGNVKGGNTLWEEKYIRANK